MRINLNNNSQMRLFTGTDSNYNFTVDYRICSILGNTHFTLGKLWLTLKFRGIHFSLLCLCCFIIECPLFTPNIPTSLKYIHDNEDWIASCNFNSLNKSHIIPLKCFNGSWISTNSLETYSNCYADGKTTLFSITSLLHPKLKFYASRSDFFAKSMTKGYYNF